MPQMLDAPVLVLADAPAGVPAPATLDLLTRKYAPAPAGDPILMRAV